MSARTLIWPGCLVMTVACSGGSTGSPGGPGPVDSTAAQDSLHFLRPAIGAPPLADRTVSFWAVQSENREIRLMYQKQSGHADSVEFARFRVDAGALVSDSEGNALAPRDSVLITLSVQDTLRLITEFHPTGLVFSSRKPARLWLKFGEADPDLNGDHVVNAADTVLLNQLTIWKQEHPGDPWSLVPSIINGGSQEVEADIPGFTRFAVAY